MSRQRPDTVDQLENQGLSYAEAGLLVVLCRTRKESWPHFRTEDLTTSEAGIRHVRRLVDGLEEKGFLRRWQIGLGPAGGVVWDWQLYPNGDAPEAAS